MFYRLHRTSINKIQTQSKDTLVLVSTPRPLGSPLFYFGISLFVVSMLSRGFLANAYGHIAVLPLGIATILLIIAIWQFSATAKAIFSIEDGKLFLVYKHLGYLQKVYTHSLSNIEKAEQVSGLSALPLLRLQKDNKESIWLGEGKQDFISIVEAINAQLLQYTHSINTPIH